MFQQNLAPGEKQSLQKKSPGFYRNDREGVKGGNVLIRIKQIKHSIMIFASLTLK